MASLELGGVGRGERREGRDDRCECECECECEWWVSAVCWWYAALISLDVDLCVGRRGEGGGEGRGGEGRGGEGRGGGERKDTSKQPKMCR